MVKGPVLFHVSNARYSRASCKGLKHCWVPKGICDFMASLSRNLDVMFSISCLAENITFIRDYGIGNSDGTKWKRGSTSYNRSVRTSPL